MTAEQGLLNLRRKIAMQMKGGSHGLMRCWVLFRNRAGSNKSGITFSEFRRGLRSYGLELPEDVARQIFDRMDVSGDGHIQIKEFIDHVMGRWKSDANTHFGGKTEQEIQGATYASGKARCKAMVVDKADERLTTEEALKLLRKSIAQRLRSGPNGLLRCWIEFRQRAGSTKDGITVHEFSRGLKAYGIPLSAVKVQELHSQMDSNGDGHIHIQEFIDRVMGRWKTDSNTHFGGKSEEAIAGKDNQGRVRAQRMVVERVDPTLTVDAAILLLRKAIAQRLRSGPNGLMRCWIEFRLRAGSSKEGITLKEFKHGLKCYGIPLHPDRSEEFFKRMDSNGDDHIHIKEFIDHVMGRWSATANSGGLEGSPKHKRGAASPLMGGGGGERVHEGLRRAREQEMRDAKKSLALDADSALRLLRAKIAQRLAGGSHGLQRAWKTFRNAGGGTHEGVDRRGLDRALHHFSLPLAPGVSQSIFNRLDMEGDGLVHEPAFVHVVMGRSKLPPSPKKT